MVVLEFYAGRSLLLTGCTGFVGKVLLEQLLRTVPDIGRIFVLIRGKKKANAAQRLHEEIFMSEIFNRLRSEIDDFEAYFYARCVAVQGDVEKDNLGMSIENLAMVTAEVNILVGCAANVDFNERLDLQLETNVAGSLRLLDVAKRCPRLDALVHVSTAYVNANRKGRVRERLPEGRLREAEALVERVKKMSPEEVVRATPSILGKYPNTYTFSKMITERLLLLRRENIPLVILRPTIVGCSLRDPVPGWIDAVSAAAALYLASGTGLVKVLHSRPYLIGDQIPVDIVCNAIIASVPRIARQNRVDVYHCGSSDLNPVSWQTVLGHWENYWANRLPEKRLSPPDLLMTTSRVRFHVRWFAKYEMLKGYLRMRSAITGAEADKKNLKRWSTVMDKARALADAFHPFVNNEWIFESTALDRLQSEMSPADVDAFPFDVRQINWFRYITIFQFGLHRFILKEDVGMPCLMENCLLPYTSSTGRDELIPHSPYAVRTDIGWALEVGSHGNPLMMKNIDDWSTSGIADRVLKSKAVRAAIAEEGEMMGQNRLEAQKRAEEIVMTMQAEMKLPVTLSFGWLIQKIFVRMFEGILVDPEDIAKIRAAAARGQVVLMPTHKSYFDFLIISVLCKIYDMPLPHIASGDDFLNLSIITWLFRSAGAFFMRRAFDGDALYSAIFAEYCKTLVKDSTPIEFFIEGTRSRTGKMLQPKTGLLSLLLEGFLEREQKAAPGRGADSCDLFIVPISLNYDLVPESASFPDELLGHQKVKESLGAVMRAYSVLFRNYGTVAVSVADPISLRQFCASCTQSIPRDLPSRALQADKAAFQNCLKDLSFSVTDSLIRKAVIMTPGIISAILLQFPAGLVMSDLINEVAWVRRILFEKGVHVLDTGSPKEAVLRSLQFLQGTACEVRSKDKARWEKMGVDEVSSVTPDASPPAEDRIVPLPALGRMHLAYFRNQLLHPFIPEAIIALSLGAAAADEGGIATLPGLRTRVQQLYTLFQVEFIWDHTLPAEEEFDSTLRGMCRRGLLKVTGGRVSKVETPEAQRYLAFISNLFYPFIDTYWAATLSLFGLLAEPGVVGTRLLDRSHRAAHALAEKGTLPYYESCSLDTLRNALTYLQNMSVVVRKSEKGEETLSRRGIVELAEPYQSSTALHAFAASIGAFRSLNSQSVNGHELLAMLLPRARL